MPELAIIVTMPECHRCVEAKERISKMGYSVAEISHESAMQRSDRDDYMAALADNGMGFPIVRMPYGEWAGWK